MRCIRGLSFAVLFLSGAALAGPTTEVSIWVGRNVAPGPRIRLSINTRNVASVQMSVYRMPATLLLHDFEEPSKRPAVSGKPVRQWSVSMIAKREQPNKAQADIYRSRQVNLPPLAPGVYLLISSGGGKEAWAVVNITHLAVVAKRSPKRALVWVTDALTGSLVKGADVKLYTKEAKVVASGRTGADGVCMMETGPGEGQTVVVTHGKDSAAVGCGLGDPDGALRVHFQTDRPIYRPGQTVCFKAILRRTRGRGYVPVADRKVEVEIRDAKDMVIAKKQLTTNAIGTLSDSVDLPEEGVIGSYSIVVTVGEERAYSTFAVAGYRKPEFKVGVKPVRKRYLAGEEAAFEVDASYYFGAPVAQAEVRYQIRRKPSPYSFHDETTAWYASSDGNLYARDTYAEQPFVAEGRVYTDAHGKVTIPVKTARDAPDSDYSIEVTVKDASRREVAASGSVPVYAAALRLGISTEIVFTPVGSLIPVRLAVADLDGKPAAAKVKIIVKHFVWDTKAEQWKPKELASTAVSVPESGKASAKVPAKAEGDLIVVATAADATGRKASAETSVWVVGPAAKVEKEEREPTLLVRLDRKHYEPGDTVKAYVSYSTKNRPVLVTAEGGDIWKHAVIAPGRKGAEFALKTQLAMSPNAYVEAAQWTANGMLSGSALVKLPDRSRKLDVSVEPARTAYKPGEQAEYVVRTVGADGRPTAAEVAISVVDESIYALRADATRDLYSAFWGVRDNGVVTNYSAPEELSGGAYQRVSELAPVRQRFVDTAYWNAHVVTGSDGTAKISFELPGNLTTWRATARAVTEDTRVGSATAKIQVSRPVMLRLATPRQLVQGDRITLIGTLNNRTNEPHEFETTISAEGLAIEDAPMKLVKVPAMGEATVEWKLVADKLPESGQAFVTGRTLATDAPPDRGEEFSDALKVGIRIVPAGIARRIAVGGVLAQEKTLTFELPADRIEPASRLTISVRAGLAQSAEGFAKQVIDFGRFGSSGAADQLLAAVVLGKAADAKEITESLALLSRYQQYRGWGWWEDDQVDPIVTARVLRALAAAREAGIAVPSSLIERGVGGAAYQFNETNLWEQRALLASAMALGSWPDAEAGGTNKIPGKDLRSNVDEVLRRGEQMSAFARLSVAEALARMGDKEQAAAIAAEVMRDAVAGPDTIYLAAGEHPGWYATTTETTAQALIVLNRLSRDAEQQAKLARWLADPENDDWRSQDETALAALALDDYVRAHPQPSSVGELEVLVNGTKVEYRGDPEKAAEVTVPRSLLKDGANTVTLKRTGGGETFVSVEARVFIPAQNEAGSGIRVLRRFEAQNGSGLWNEINGPIKPSAPVRCTVLVWPDDRPDGIRVIEPIPAGFEFVDSDQTGLWTREEVRDGAVIHYLRSTGQPIYFRYYLRSESEGNVTALPASAESIRRPNVRGNSAAAVLDVAR